MDEDKSNQTKGTDGSTRRRLSAAEFIESEFNITGCTVVRRGFIAFYRGYAVRADSVSVPLRPEGSDPEQSSKGVVTVADIEQRMTSAGFLVTGAETSEDGSRAIVSYVVVDSEGRTRFIDAERFEMARNL